MPKPKPPTPPEPHHGPATLLKDWAGHPEGTLLNTHQADLPQNGGLLVDPECMSSLITAGLGKPLPPARGPYKLVEPWDGHKSGTVLVPEGASKAYKGGLGVDPGRLAGLAGAGRAEAMPEPKTAKSDGEAPKAGAKAKAEANTKPEKE